MKKMKKIVLICFYDKISVSIRALSSVIKKKGHECHLVAFKEDRSGVIDKFNDNSTYHQYLFNGKLIGCGNDINPPTEKELSLIQDYVGKEKPDIIGFSVRSMMFDLSKNIASRFRKVLPNTTIIGGGYGTSLEPEKFLKIFDYICIGEGEKFIDNFIDYIDKDLSKIHNLGRKSGSDYLQNSLGTPYDLDTNIPDWDFPNKILIENNKVVPLSEAYDTRTYDIFVSRGCPATCTYCMANQMKNIYHKHNTEYPKARLRSVTSVIKELALAKDKFNINYVRFMDSIFGYNRRWLFEFLDEYDKHIGLRFFCNLDTRFTKKDMITRLQASNLMQTTVGIQSTSEDIRTKIMGRRTTDNELVDYAWNLHNIGIKFQYDMIHWNPFETEKSLSNGISLLRRLPKNGQIVLFQLKFFPESPITKLYAKEKPPSLKKEIFDFYAWIYTFILTGGKFEQLASVIEPYETFKRNPELLRDFYLEMKASEYSNVIIAGKDIKKDSIVLTTMIDYRKKTDEESTAMYDNPLEGNGTKKNEASEFGISFDDREKLVNCISRRDIKEGELIRSDDIYSSYGEKKIF
jgi:radical SAM superfamily enzyme YgiQ (UPF0313 family)